MKQKKLPKFITNVTMILDFHLKASHISHLILTWVIQGQIYVKPTNLKILKEIQFSLPLPGLSLSIYHSDDDEKFSELCQLLKTNRYLTQLDVAFSTVNIRRCENLCSMLKTNKVIIIYFCFKVSLFFFKIMVSFC